MDKYILGQSEKKELTLEKPKIKLDLKLKKNIHINQSTIYGVIVDCNKKPIKGAHIKIFDNSCTQIGYTQSIDNGLYIYGGIEKGSKIQVKVCKKGYKKYISQLFRICYSKYNKDVYLNKKAVLSIISGHIYDESRELLSNIEISLLKKEDHTFQELYKYTYSNPSGQFLFTDVIKGTYKIIIDNEKYDIYSKVVNINEDNKIIDIDIILSKKENNTVIEGYIYNDSGTPIPGATVVLYKVLNDEKKPIEYTKCDEKGFYKFVGVRFNNYLIKALL